MVLNHLIFAGAFLALMGTVASDDKIPPGFLEGHLAIVSPKTVDLADENAATVTGAAYSGYPLIILSSDGKKEIARVTADSKGHYRVALPPGDYLLDVHGRARGHARAKVKSFTVISNQTVRADMELDTGVR